jgi:hypothetical protein
LTTPPGDPSSPQPPPTRRPARQPDGGLFRKRPDAIGPAPLFFSVALGITFGLSLGLLVGYPIVGVIFGGMLGALYGVLRHQGR